jgi:hypothetical protein
MLPLDPPLSRGARPGMFNPDRPVDDTALAAFDLDPENPGVQVDLARSLLDGDPENIWAMMVLARHTGSSVEYMALLRVSTAVRFQASAAE